RLKRYFGGFRCKFQRRNGRFSRCAASKRGSTHNQTIRDRLSGLFHRSNCSSIQFYVATTFQSSIGVRLEEVPTPMRLSMGNNACGRSGSFTAETTVYRRNLIQLME